MNKIITVYGLLGLIKDGKAPKKIKYNNTIYNLSQDKQIWIDRLYRKEENSDVSLNFDYIGNLNSKVEILDEEDEFIEITEINTQTFPRHNNSLEKTANKVNQLIHNQKIIIEKMKEKE